MVWFACLSVGCGAASPTAGGAPVIDPSEWQFPSDADRARYEAVRAELAGRFPGGSHRPVDRVGGFLQERWCAAGAPDGCARAEGPGDRATLSVLHFGNRYPAVFGLVVDAAASGPEGAVASVHWAVDGRSIVGDALIVRVGAGAGEPDALTLGSRLVYAAADSTLEVAMPADERGAALAALVGSAASFAAEAAAELDAVEARVVAALDAGEVERCEYAPYEGDSKPPLCTRVALTDAERDAERDRLAGYLADRRALVAAHGPALWAAVRAAVPRALAP